MTPRTGRIQRHPAPPLIIDLFREGFSTEEILHLLNLRDRYPHCEYLSQAERERLAFLKWQVERGNRD